MGKEAAEKAIKELDHSNWMDNWIRVKFDKFEMSKEESWKRKINKDSTPLFPRFEHCDRGEIEYETNFKASGLLNETAKCKVIDSNSKKGLSEYLKNIRHNHCVKVVDSMVKAKELGTLDVCEIKNSVKIIKGTMITSSKQDPRELIEYADIDF